MNQYEPHIQQQLQQLQQEQEENENREPTLGSTIYWQMLVALFGFVISLGLQLRLGLPVMIDLLCGTQPSQIEAESCSILALQSIFLVSLSVTSALGVALGASILGSFRKTSGSFLFSFAMSYLYFVLSASLYQDFFLDLISGVGGNNAYMLALVAIGGGLIASLSYHIPRWVLGEAEPPPPQNSLAEGL